MISKRMNGTDHFLTHQDLLKAHKTFHEKETRDLFYRVATYLVSQAIKGDRAFTVPEALAVLLQTWNAQYYRFHSFDSDFQGIKQLWLEYEQRLREWSTRTIQDFEISDVSDVYQAFEGVLGQVGAAKTLHLLCPRLFPLWDRKIIRAYKVSLDRVEGYSLKYLKFMSICKEQVTHLAESEVIGDDILKNIDEYNYCRFSKGWI
jgi:hypothetical protein